MHHFLICGIGVLTHIMSNNYIIVFFKVYIYLTLYGNIKLYFIYYK